MCCAFVEKLYVCLQLLLCKALSCHVQNFKIVSEIQEIYSTRVIVCQCCERLFVPNGLWRWSLWLCALSSWRRLDSWGVETGARCDNTVERGACGEVFSFVSTLVCERLYHGMTVTHW